MIVSERKPGNLFKNPTSKSQRYPLMAIMFLSGFAGLGYEMVWTRTPSVGLGHEIVSVLAVISAFFRGLAVGSLEH